jgi:hypothetical protein
MDLSEKDRWMIANQLKILEKLYPEEAKNYSVQRKAIERGYKLHYLGLTEYFEKEMPEEKCKEVIEILNMYRAITFSYQKAEDKEGLEESAIRFEGFDGNEEGEQFGYTLYFIEDLGRFDELRGGAEYPYLNSHRNMLYKYRKMLQIWYQYEKRHPLTIAQIKELLEA